MVGGLVLLVIGGEGLVRGALRLSERLGLSRSLIGIVVIGFGTSMPELVVSIEAAMDGLAGIAVGNVVGSNIANVLLVLGLAGLVRPQVVCERVLYRDGLFLMVVTAGMAALLLLSDTIGRVASATMLAIFGAFLVYSYRIDEQLQPPEDADAKPPSRPRRPILIPILMAVAGVIGLAWGAQLFVGSAAAIATTWGVSTTVIGLSIVAVGTSLPELVASLVAARKGETELAVGNIIGSNLFNLLLILGAGAMVSPLSLAALNVTFDVWAMLIATVLLLIGLATGLKVDRREAGIFVALYIAYGAHLAMA